AARHPRLRIDASYSDHFVDLIAERFDAAVRLGNLADSSLVARRIAPIRAVIVASPAYLKRHGRPRTPDELSRHEAVLQISRGDVRMWQFRAGRRTISVRPEGRFRADNGEAILQAALAGLGIALLPTFLVSASIESGALEVLLPDYEVPEAGL